MSTIQFPPPEKLKLLGNMTRGQIVGVGATLIIGVFAVMTKRYWWLLSAPVVLTWTFLPTPARPFRTRVPARLRWMLRREKSWSAPLGGKNKGAPFLRGAKIHLAADKTSSGATGVLEMRGGFTTVIEVSRESMVFDSEGTQIAMLSEWGAVLGSLCVERGLELTAERIGWTDVHTAANPGSLYREHQQRAVEGGPANADYYASLENYRELASSHTVYVWVTITRSSLRAARASGITGAVPEICQQAAVAVGRTVAFELSQRGFRVSALLSPAQLGRLVNEVCDPFRPDEPVSQRERFGLVDRWGPERVDEQRGHVACDRAFHRGFVLRYPRGDTAATWLWNVLATPGPKVVSTTYLPIPPTIADRQRDGSMIRGRSNMEIQATSGQKRIRVKDRQKFEALQRAEAEVAGGHHELDAVTFIVVAGRTEAELEQRTATMRQAARQASRATLREMVAEHGSVLALALPLGLKAPGSVE